MKGARQREFPTCTSGKYMQDILKKSFIVWRGKRRTRATRGTEEGGGARESM